MKYHKILLFADSCCYFEDIDLNHDKILEDLKKVKYQHMPIGKAGSIYNKEFSGVYNSFDIKNVLNEIQEKEKILTEFNKLLNFAVKEHFQFNVKFKIDTIWSNKCLPQSSGEFHRHTNYWLSGVYYPHGMVSDNFHLVFEKIFTDPFNIKTINYNNFNSETFSVYVKRGTLLIFPAHYRHKVGFNNTESDRYSIAFNVLPEGKLSEINSVWQ